jgi:phage repressor protein C with HTH and peptisase S24 domain
MAPAYPHGKIVFARRRKVARVGDVVIVQHHKMELIKRVGQISNEGVYVVGDNPDNSTDSRHYGWLPLSSIIGVVIGGQARD